MMVDEYLFRRRVRQNLLKLVCSMERIEIKADDKVASSDGILCSCGLVLMDENISCHFLSNQKIQIVRSPVRQNYLPVLLSAKPEEMIHSQTASQCISIRLHMAHYCDVFRPADEGDQHVYVIWSDILHCLFIFSLVQNYKIILHFINEIPNFVRILLKRKYKISR